MLTLLVRLSAGLQAWVAHHHSELCPFFGQPSIETSGPTTGNRLSRQFFAVKLISDARPGLAVVMLFIEGRPSATAPEATRSARHRDPGA